MSMHSIQFGNRLNNEINLKYKNLIFEDDNIKSVSLSVFDFNQNAKKIYEKLGFEIDEVIETPKLKYIMKRCR